MSSDIVIYCKTRLDFFLHERLAKTTDAGRRILDAGYLPQASIRHPASFVLNYFAILSHIRIRDDFLRIDNDVWSYSLEVKKGTIAALLGFKGAGKSTTLKAISGFLPLEDGAITDGAIHPPEPVQTTRYCLRGR